MFSICCVGLARRVYLADSRMVMCVGLLTRARFSALKISRTECGAQRNRRRSEASGLAEKIVSCSGLADAVRGVYGTWFVGEGPLVCELCVLLSLVEVRKRWKAKSLYRNRSTRT
jgi:hypothetical protein